MRNCSLTSVMPTILVTTQKKLSLKYENTIAPMHADIVANTGLMLRLARIGAEIDAAVIMDTVPLPWISLITVAMINGTRIAGSGILEITCAR